jgi:RNA polymerase sigma-70 factor (ECF subfamily)
MSDPRTTHPAAAPEVAAAPQRTPSPRAAARDDERAWLAPLASTGPEHNRAVAELHGLLLRASVFEVKRRAAACGLAGASELDDLAQQAADDALLAVLARLDRFERRSRFTTWAYKFAIHTAGVAVRRHAWRGRALAPGSAEALSRLADLAHGPAADAESRELLAEIVAAIGLLTPHQRDVLLALAVDGVPIDVLAERLSTTRGALYKTLHDARTRLRALLDCQEAIT